ncbi:Rrf2 family transcriptional regulator [Roseateles amylovorans]|uniref:Rrf2 family transcriptional regulator n=1 Tax=Roseateles amylovorans TaxID=2978473 RepID=A0ABY6AWK7_9BURK|nr:Rrf2 family transcriptional regulator [Roseateles amylovorans]UXH77564.1 Rrf2 family transcriptional regulator [Roseateles amylovorans]
MKPSSQLSDALHILLHLAQVDTPLTSDTLASAIDTNPVVLRRMMAGLREAGFVLSEKGHGGGWVMSAPIDRITLRDVHMALGSPALISLGFREDQPQCLVAQVVNESLRESMAQAEAVLLARLGEITLSALAKEFGRRRPTCGSSHSFFSHHIEDDHDPL